MKRLPKYHETFIPILRVLNDEGLLHYNDLRNRVKDKFYSDLPLELLLEKTKSGDLIILNRIGWGKAYLKQAKMVEQPERAMVKITEKGKKVLEKNHLTLEEIMNDSDFLAHRQTQKLSKEIEDQIGSSNASPGDMIEFGFRSIETRVKDDLLEKLKQSDPYYFEKVVLKLLDKMGYGDFLETAKSNDGGIDGIINQDQLGIDKIYVQAKRWSDNKVREKDIRNFIGAMSGDTQKGIFVTTSLFDEGAIKKARDAHHKIILINGVKLVELMHKYNVGVQIKDIYEVKEVDEDFFDAE